MTRSRPGLLIPASALLWGLQFAFLSPVLALLLVALYHCTDAQVGLVLALYNASGFVASMLIPALADRKGDYLRPMLICSALSVVVTVGMALTNSLPVAAVLLVAFGGPAGTGMTLLFAQLKAAGLSTQATMNTRAVISFAWVVGPPLLTLLLPVAGERGVLVIIAVTAVLCGLTTLAMRRGGRVTITVEDQPQGVTSRTAVVLVMISFIALQATNAATMSMMTLFTTTTLGLSVTWAGLALAVAAVVEIPALVVLGRLGRRWSELALTAAGCLLGIGYYLAMAVAQGPVVLLAAQVLNASFYAVIGGLGITLFQQLIPKPGLASGMYTNTRRIGAIVSGVIIAFAPALTGSYRGIFLVSAGLTVVGLAGVLLARRYVTRT